MQLSNEALELTRLIGSKELSFGCIVECDMFWRKEWFVWVWWRKMTEYWIWVWIYQYDRFDIDWVPNEIIWHPCQEYNLRKWADNFWLIVEITNTHLTIISWKNLNELVLDISYEGTFPLYSQEPTTLTQIINLIKQYENKTPNNS